MPSWSIALLAVLAYLVFSVMFAIFLGRCARHLKALADRPAPERHLHYTASPGQPLSPEELEDAARRSRMLSW
jgi:hypothetical protein